MTSAKVGQRMKRWGEQRWILDAVIATVGPEWDQARLAAKARPGGREAAGEFRLAGSRMKKFDDIAREFAASARRREAKANALADQGRMVSAGESYIIASLLWASARWPIFEVNDEILGYEDRMNSCYDKFIAFASHPIERVELPFGDKSLPAFFHLPHKPKSGEKFPAILIIGGMDGSKENMVSIYGDPLLSRGMAVLALDGPGQGECCTRGIHVTESNHADAAAAALDWLAACPDVDADRIAIKGSSFGTYWGTVAAAAHGGRIKGFAASGICQEPGCNTIFNMASPSFKARYMFMSGYEDEAEFDEFAKKIDLRPIAGNITCPYMILAGENDHLSPVEHTYELFDQITAPKRLVVYQGAHHGIGGTQSATLGEDGATMMADWLRDRVNGKDMVSEKWFIESSGRARITPY